MAGVNPKRRISRACDKCHASRTKCNGEQPCCRCVGFAMECTYTRRAKKRGRIPAVPETGSISEVLPRQYHEASALGTSTLGASALETSALEETVTEDLPNLSAPFGKQFLAIPKHHDVNMIGDQQSDIGLQFFGQQPTPTLGSLKYPVLRPLLEYTSHFLSESLASELLETYFSTISGNGYQPASPFLLTFIFRRSSFISSHRHRTCNPALLCSMLWVASLTGPNADSRTSLSKKLVELTLDLLYPMWYSYFKGNKDYVWLRSLEATHGSVKLPTSQNEEDKETASALSTESIDLLVTIIHIATVCSASEQKGASLRWWAMAWAMAKDIKLHREVARATGAENMARQFSPFASSPEINGQLSEQHREERRRIWWLLYMVDRHLSLCYNRPLTFTDVECAALLQPLDDKLWQEISEGDLEQGVFGYSTRMIGPQTLCRRGDLFGFFLPLMTILGGIIDMFRVINHPRFKRSNSQNLFSDAVTLSLTAQLNEYSDSLDVCEANQSNNSSEFKTAFAYARYILNVIHILLFCKWDPIELIDDDDLWISSAAFASALRHAIDAAKYLEQIMNEDIDLSYMPWFFGIELLHGSIIILLVVDKLECQTTASMIKACESIVRAHEACNATLCNTYQRNFRKLMLSTLAQAKSRSGEHRSEKLLAEKDWRRQILLLYRWTNDGTGLAL